MYSAPDGSATPQTVEYYRARANGGAALCIVEITFTDDKGSRAFHAQLGAHDDRMIPGLSDIAEAIRSSGAVAGIQLGHCGPQRVISEPPVVAASPIPWMQGKRTPEELTQEQIAVIVSDHGQATRRAAQAGFQLLELHAAHGYLVNAFLTPASNTRTDEYGGSLENRMRFLLEVVREMRNELGPRRLLSVRLNGDDLLEGGMGIKEYCKISRALADNGVDLIHVSAGTYRAMDKRIPPMYLSKETFAGYAAPIRNASGLPVIASGNIHDMQEADRIIDADEADFIALARPLFADPELPNKVLTGQAHKVRPCIRCNTCVGREQSGKRAFCSVNPRTGHETRPQRSKIAKKSVSIVGAGPAGIEFAISAANRGHSVTLWEKSQSIGGLIRIAAGLSFKHTLPRLLEYYESVLQASGVKVILGKEANPGELGDDLVVIATGAPWELPTQVLKNPKIPVLTPSEAIMYPEQAGARTLVVGGGLIGAEIALALSKNSNVILAERDSDFDEDVNLHARLFLIPALANRNVDVRHSTEIVHISGNFADFESHGKRIREHIDTIVWTPRPNQTYSNLNSTEIRIGECAGARGLLETNMSAYRIAEELI
jgi:2,4-dienoyl-CoA reductase-like NADH-dependent reductase (Old Yellow Enzyme family)